MKEEFYLDNLLQYNQLHSDLIKLEEITKAELYKEVSYTGNITINGLEEGSQDIVYNSHNEALHKVNTILSEHEAIKYSHPHHSFRFGQLHLKADKLEWENFPNIYNWIKEKIILLYGSDIDNIDNLKLDKPTPTLYTKGCRLSNHKDGKRPDQHEWDFIHLGNVLIYLNHDYDKQNGGLFVINETIEVIPEFGNIVILNLSDESDPSHCVTEIQEKNRYALLFGVTYNK